MAATTLWLCCGCADLLEIPDSPFVVSTDPWQCMGAEPIASTSNKALVRVHACSFISSNCSTPVTGLTASLCDKRDFNCSTPIQTGIQDVNGDLSFEVPTGGSLGSGFDGYLLVTSPLELCTNRTPLGGSGSCILAPGCDESMPDDKCNVRPFITGLLFFNPPVVADLAEPIVLPLVPSLAAVSLVMAAGATSLDGNLGTVFATGLDCEGRPAAGLMFGVSPAPVTIGSLYQVNGVVSTSATETDSSGLGGLLGIPAGFIEISAYVGDGMNRREVASTGAQVNGTTVTYVTLVPPRH